jgi:hypothetical protein
MRRNHLNWRPCCRSWSRFVLYTHDHTRPHIFFHLVLSNWNCVVGPGLLTRSVLDTNVPNVVALEKDTRFIPTLTVRTPSPISNSYPSSDTDWCIFSNWQMPQIIGSRYSKAMLWKCLILKSCSWREYHLR